MKPSRIKFLIAAALIIVFRASGENAVTNWNTIAATTIVTKGGIGPGPAGVFFAYVSIAVYDAVDAVHHEKFEPLYYPRAAPLGASDEAAAVAAAHRVLVNYFPAQEAILDADFNSSLRTLTATPRAIAEGVRVGEAAAEALISERTGDGLNADLPYDRPPAPGVWEPNPPGSSPVAPWLGQMRPFTMRSAAQFLPEGPTALTSEEWVADYNLTRLFGGATSDLRTAGQTEIGKFWTTNTAAQYSQTFNGLVQEHNLDVMDSARFMAMLWTGYADAAIGCYNAKYFYAFWRPWAAIPAGGANPDAVADPTWTPLLTTPNHPEYPAAHACLTSAVTDLVADYFGTRKVHVSLSSTVFSDGVHTHTFDDVNDWLYEVHWARIYAGFHFNHSLQDGAELGRRVAQQLVKTHFRLEDRRDRH
jgi:hypothetical protein